MQEAMVADVIQHFSCYHHRKGFGWILNKVQHVLLTCFANFSFSGLDVHNFMSLRSVLTFSESCSGMQCYCPDIM